MRRRRSQFLALGVSVLGLSATGCPDRTISSVNPQQQGAVKKDIPTSADIDILFVIDNSASTADKQTVFAANFPKFVAALDAFPSGRPNLHIGVIDTTIDIGVQWLRRTGQGLSGAGSGRQRQVPDRRAEPDGLHGAQPGAIHRRRRDRLGGARMTNYPGTLESELACTAQVGASGCGFEAQLEAMRRALDGTTNSGNSGFIRDGAFLAIIFLTDEDDASTKNNGVFSLPDDTVGGRNDFRVQPLFAYACDQPIQANSGSNYTNCKPDLNSQYLQDPAFYSQFLASVKDPAQTVVAIIAGPPAGFSTNDNPPQTGTGPMGSGSIATGALQLNGNTQNPALEPSCNATINGDPAIARPAVRLASFLSAYGDHGRFYSVCQGDYSAALTDIGNTLFNAISPCLEGPVDLTDVNPSNPGLQLQCTVTDTQNAGGSDETDQLLPVCQMQDAMTPTSGQPSCYYITMDSTACPSPDEGVVINFDRQMPPPTGTTTEVQCAVSSQGSN